jgi:sigma-E factor negative regulatory protein RseC
MISSEGVVVAIEADSQDVWVEIPERASACGNCSRADGCHSGLIGLGNGARRYRVMNRIGARLGERVSLTVAEGTVLRASWFSYLMPALLAIAAATVGQSLADDPGAIVGTLFGLGGGLFFLRWNETRLRRSGSVLSLERSQVAACHISESL